MANHSRAQQRARASKTIADLAKFERETVREINLGGRKINPDKLRLYLTTKYETPLEYMLKVMNDPEQPIHRRDMMAMVAAPFIHPKVIPVDAVGQYGEEEQQRQKSFTLSLANYESSQVAEEDE